MIVGLSSLLVSRWPAAPLAVAMYFSTARCAPSMQISRLQRDQLPLGPHHPENGPRPCSMSPFLRRRTTSLRSLMFLPPPISLPLPCSSGLHAPDRLHHHHAVPAALARHHCNMEARLLLLLLLRHHLHLVPVPLVRPLLLLLSRLHQLSQWLFHRDQCH